MLQDRSTESFIMALKRFSNRRGRPSIIHSDNAGEYVSGRNTIQEVFRVLNTQRTHQRLQDELKKVPDQAKPLIETILAHWYWQYFQQNRYRFMQRTETDEPLGKDFTTWDLPRIYREIDLHFSHALADGRL